MKYMGDAKWWNDNVRDRKLNVMTHEKCLEEDIEIFSKECRVLDIACGDGRNAIYLARLGYDVLGIDFSEEALNRLNYFIKQENLEIKTKLADLSSEEVFLGLHKFDVVIINHYRLKPQLYSRLINYIKEDGFLWVNGFRDIPKDNSNITRNDLLLEEDFIELENCILENKKLYEMNQRKFVRYIWRIKSY